MTDKAFLRIVVFFLVLHLVAAVGPLMMMKENPKPFQDDLNSVPWWTCSIFEDVDDIAWAWENLFNDVVNCHVATRRVKARQRSLPWMNSEIRKAMNKRYKLLRLCDGSQASKKNWEDYKKARNNVTKLLRSAETQYWKDQFANANNSRQFWKTVNSVNGKQYSSRIGPLKDHVHVVN